MCEKQKDQFRILDNLRQNTRTGQFWIIIRKLRQRQPITQNTVTIKDLISRFAKNYIEIHECVSSAAVEVNKKLHELKNIDFSNVTLSEYQVKDYITKLKKGCAAGIDGVTAEHLQYGKNTGLAVVRTKGI